jgi:hypothetical protein
MPELLRGFIEIFHTAPPLRAQCMTWVGAKPHACDFCRTHERSPAGLRNFHTAPITRLPQTLPPGLSATTSTATTPRNRLLHCCIHCLHPPLASLPAYDQQFSLSAPRGGRTGATVLPSRCSFTRRITLLWINRHVCSRTYHRWFLDSVRGRLLW